MLCNRLFFFLHFGIEPRPFFGAQPLRVGRPIGQVKEADHPEDDRRRGLAEEQPFPASKTQNPIELEEGRRDRRTEPDRHRDRSHEAGNDPRPVQRREPVGEIKDHAGEEPGLGEAKAEPQDKKS